MVQRLQIIYERQIVLISCGAFYIAIGADAVTLNREFNLQTICAKRNICKVGIPKSSIEKYVTKLKKEDYGYMVFDYNNEENEISIKYENWGKHRNINDINAGCSGCINSKNIKITKYDEALNKYLKQEFGENYND